MNCSLLHKEMITTASISGILSWLSLTKHIRIILTTVASGWEHFIIVFASNLFIMSQILSRFFNLPIVSIWPICAYSLLHTSQNWYCGLHWSSSSFAPYLEDWSIMQLRNSGNVMLYGWSCGWNLAFEHGWCHLRAKSLSLTVWIYADTNLIQGFLWKHKC